MNAQTLAEEGINVERGAKNVEKILHPQELGLTKEQLAERQPIRKQRSDAGKSRESFYVSIPGVHSHKVWNSLSKIRQF
jgi:hypothetical protein